MISTIILVINNIIICNIFISISIYIINNIIIINIIYLIVVKL